MKKIILPGILAGIIMLVASMALGYVFQVILFPHLAQEYVNGIFRSWSDPLMSIYFVYPFILGIILAWAWNMLKPILVQKRKWERGICFGFGIWLVSSIPGMIMAYSSFKISLIMTLTWLITGLVDAIIAGIVFSKMNKIDEVK